MIEQSQVNLGTAQISYRTCGSGPDILMLHGWVSSSRTWLRLMDNLASTYRVWAVDLVGFGDSPYVSSDDPLCALSLDEHAVIVTDFCKALNIQPYAVIGHSMGGSLALKLALDYPGLMQRLALIAPIVSGKLGSHIELVVNRIDRPVTLRSGRHLWPLLARTISLSVGSMSYLDRSSKRYNADDVLKANWRAAYGGVRSMAGLQLHKRLAEIKIPTLIFVGSRDPVVQPSESRLAASLIQNSRLLELPGHYHHIADEAPELLHNAMREFLESQEDKHVS